jgi:hypothetical protein
VGKCQLLRIGALLSQIALDLLLDLRDPLAELGLLAIAGDTAHVELVLLAVDDVADVRFVESCRQRRRHLDGRSAVPLGL